MSRIVSFVGSKGGVGVSSLVFELAKYIARSGCRVVVFDANFGFNEISLMFAKRGEIDFKDYLTGRVTDADVINLAERGLYYIKTNKPDFDYIKHKPLIKEFFAKIRERFEYILIDVNCFNFLSLSLMFDISSECVIVMGDTKTDAINAYKISTKINNYKNITNTKLVINKANIIMQKNKKRLNASEVSNLVFREVLFVIPRFVKRCYFSYKRKTKSQQKIILYFCNAFITNKNYIIDYQKKYSGLIGLVRKKVGAKYEK